MKTIMAFWRLSASVNIFSVNSKFCNGGHICTPPKECCPLGCCLIFAPPGYRPTKSQVSENYTSMSDFLLWNHWLLWILLVFVLVLVCGCGLWRKRQVFSGRLHRRSSRNDEERSELDSTGSCYPPPQYSRCSSFLYAPPPYTEVTSKPELYPLVISYKTDNGKHGENCVMVQYFRNYVVHPELSAAGTTLDPLNSSFYSSTIRGGDFNHPPSYEESSLSQFYIPESELELMHQPESQRSHKSTHYSTQHGKESGIKNSQSRNKFQSRGSLQYKNVNVGSRCQEVILKNFIKDSTSVHQYTPDVILAQPQRYCESNSDFCCDSSDLLNNINTNSFLNQTNDSCSSEDNISQARGSLQDFVSSDGLTHSQYSNLETANYSTSSEISSLQGCGTPDSPPQAISPTGEFRNLLAKIQQLPSRRETAGGKSFESKSFEYVMHHLTSPVFNAEDSSCSVHGESRVFDPSEKCGLLEQQTKFDNFCLRHKYSKEKNIPKKSKTFFLPLCPVRYSLTPQKNFQNSPKQSSSAPVTPVNYNSPITLLFMQGNARQMISKNHNISTSNDSELLIQEEEEEEREIDENKNLNAL